MKCSKQQTPQLLPEYMKYI